MQNKSLSLKEKLSYGFGSLGASTIYGIMSTYLLLFYTDYFGISAVAVGVLFLVARSLDAVSDLVMGVIVDNTHTRWGRFRPYILFAPFFIAITTVLCFTTPNLDSTGKLIWAYGTYIAWGLAFTSRDIPFWSLSAAITQDTAERNSVVMLPRTVAMIGIISVNVVTLPLVGALGKGNANSGWQYVAAIYGCLCVIFSLITFFNVKEKAIERKEHRQTFKDVLHQIKQNGPLKTLLVFMLITETVTTIKNIFPAYYLKNNYNSPQLIPLFMGAYAIMVIVGAVVTPWVAKKLGKKKAVLYSSIASSCTSIGLFFSGYHSLWLLFFWVVLMGVVDGIAEIVRNSMLADTVEYGQWKTGTRSEGMVFSTNIFKTKVASALGGAMGAFLLGAIGYISIPGAAQSAATLNGIHYAFTLVPGALSLFALIPLLKYNLTEEKYKEILNEMQGKETECNE